MYGYTLYRHINYLLLYIVLISYITILTNILLNIIYVHIKSYYMYCELYLFIYPVYLGLQLTKLLQERMVPGRPPWAGAWAKDLCLHWL
jgi:hypothetical protein